ncbi:Na(+) H(+) antiporter subunit G [Caenispirillum salinarum AK4]|uniref:Na(+) H(+) antiporter subunit G n=1 Tax=Caenispirillum salinarum AK4 TaxID=1238182 RepID=K9GQ44_9PROT|nr:monovalent cation/H(+) antiporter subunit G [Caenispirillum salinarum]EKV28070.1 Na(+) H(+) antiporter subunit G [Caenispirillum salinarum AK4]
MIADIVIALLLVLGAFFAFVAALGVARLPDVFIRMHASTKAGTLGAGLILAAVALFFGEAAVTARAVAIIAFLLITAPIGAHIIGRAAYRTGVPLWSGSVVDEWAARPPAPVAAQASDTPETRHEAGQNARP